MHAFCTRPANGAFIFTAADGSPSGKYPKLRVTAIKLLSGTNRKLRESPLEPLRGWMQIFQFDEPDAHLFASLEVAPGKQSAWILLA